MLFDKKIDVGGITSSGNDFVADVGIRFYTPLSLPFYWFIS
jgi:hypothetical protein